MLLEPDPTPYDLRWRMLGTSVRVHPMFWLFTAILGWSWMDLGFQYLALWVACVFVSILLHEFGHVLMGRVFGADSYIVMYSFGGLAVGANDLSSRWKRIAVCLAGPGIELALYGLLWAALGLGGRNVLVVKLLVDPDPVTAIEYFLLEINFYWALLNLLPIWPLDGGQVSRDLCTHFSPRGGLRFSLGLSAVVAAALAVNSLMSMKGGRGFLPEFVPTGGLYTVLLFGALAFESFQLMSRVPRARSYEPDDRLPWEREREPEPWER
jgi:Zn-dependent protease